MEVDGRKTEEEDPREKEKFCKPCNRENLTVSANGICTECEEYMCKVCFGHHLKAKFCSDHVLTEIIHYNKQTAKINVEICTEHDNEKVKFFCRKHSEVGCGECMVLEHNACKPEYIKELSKNLCNEKSFQGMEKKLNVLEKEASDAIKLTQDQRKESTNLLEKALEEIRLFRNLMNDYLDKAEAKVVSDVKSIHSENETRMENVAERVESVLTDIKAMQQDMTEELHRETVLFINSVHCKPKLEITEQSLDSAKANNFIEQFTFKADEKKTKLTSSEQQLGLLIKCIPKQNSETSDSQTSSSYCRKKWRKCDLKPSIFYVGVRVRRGPDWNAGNTDGNGLGTVTKVFDDNSLNVDWDNGGKKHPCLAGASGLFTIEPA